MNKYVFFIDKNKFETEKEEVTAGEILADFAKVSSDEYLLALKIANEVREFNDLNEVITMKNGLHFSLLSKKPTTVS